MSKCWYCNNELTTGDNPKHFGICNKCYDEMFKNGDAIIRSLTNKIAELKQQLAEKDAEIKQLKLDLGMFRSVNEFINGYGIEKAREVLLQTEKTKQQDKISFAIEQLEKLKVELHIIHTNGYLKAIDEEIDDQIKELKEGK